MEPDGGQKVPWLVIKHSCTPFLCITLGRVPRDGNVGSLFGRLILPPTKHCATWYNWLVGLWSKVNQFPIGLHCTQYMPNEHGHNSEVAFSANLLQKTGIKTVETHGRSIYVLVSHFHTVNRGPILIPLDPRWLPGVFRYARWKLLTSQWWLEVMVTSFLLLLLLHLSPLLATDTRLTTCL